MEKKCLCDRCTNNLRSSIQIFSFLVDCTFDHVDKKESYSFFKLYAGAADQFAYLIKKNWTIEEIKKEIKNIMEDNTKLIDSEKEKMQKELIMLIQEAGKDPLIKD